MCEAEIGAPHPLLPRIKKIKQLAPVNLILLLLKLQEETD